MSYEEDILKGNKMALLRVLRLISAPEKSCDRGTIENGNLKMRIDEIGKSLESLESDGKIRLTKEKIFLENTPCKPNLICVK